MPGRSRREPEVCQSSFSPDRNEYACPASPVLHAGEARAAWWIGPTRVARRAVRRERAEPWVAGRTARGRGGPGPAPPVARGAPPSRGGPEGGGGGARKARRGERQGAR